MPIYDAICLLCWHKRAQQQNNSRGAWWAAAPISMLHFLQPIFLMPRAAVVGPNVQRATNNAQHTTRCCPAVTGELFISRKRVVCPWQQQRALTPKCCLKCCAAAKEKTQAWLEGERSPRSTRQCGDLLSSSSPHGADRVSSCAATALAQLLTRQRCQPQANGAWQEYHKQEKR